MFAAGADVVEVVGDGLFVGGQLSEKQKDSNCDDHDAEGEEDELEEDRARGLARDICHERKRRMLIVKHTRQYSWI